MNEESQNSDGDENDRSLQYPYVISDMDKKLTEK